MATGEATKLMTAAEFLALPDDGTERWLIRGQLREAGKSGFPMTVRNRWHSRILIRVGQFLDNWLDLQPKPRGEVLGGEAGCRLRRDPDTIVGVDVVYVSAELAAHTPADTTLIDGVPILVVEILSPNDTLEGIHEKIRDYLRIGVAIAWVIDPEDRAVKIYRPGKSVEMVNDTQELTAEPNLPGFRVPVAQLFE
jgi:Uma2 family endonuclease